MTKRFRNADGNVTFRARYRTSNPCKVCGKFVEIGDLMSWSRRNRGVYYHAACFNANTKDVLEKLEAGQDVQVNKPLVEEDITPAEVVEEVLAEAEVAPIEVAEVVPVQIDGRHHQFSLLMQLVRAHSEAVPVNVWMVGPAGSGKTKACEQVAQELGTDFFFTGAVSEPYSLLGYKDANGNYVSTTFRQAYENGGVFLLDEVDGSSANALLVFNAALANGHCAFPDKVVKRHANCVIIAAANTFGLGGTSDYVGRVKLDAATLSRFVWLDWQYDERLEKSLANNDKWFNRVTSIRRRCKELGLKLLVTPRATYTGAALLKAGIPQQTVELLTIKQGMTDDQWAQVSR